MAFFKKSQPVLLFDTGKQGKLADIAAEARKETGDWKIRKNLLDGCVAAFREGKPENLACFLANYLSLKREVGDVTKLANGPMDEGFKGLVAKPSCLLIEESNKPMETLDLLSKNMSPYFKQVFLDLILREATASQGAYAAQIVLDAGADPNTGSGRPVANAVLRQDHKTIELLYRYGADFTKQPENLKEGLPEKITQAFEECKRKNLSVDFGRSAEKIDMVAKETTRVKPPPLRKLNTEVPGESTAQTTPKKLNL